jgi:hypothetical protein
MNESKASQQDDQRGDFEFSKLYAADRNNLDPEGLGFANGMPRRRLASPYPGCYIGSPRYLGV